jgi:hypothetical protein
MSSQRQTGIVARQCKETKLTASSAQNVRLVVAFTKAGGTLRYSKSSAINIPRNH